MTEFKKRKFTVIKKAVDTTVADFLYNYILLKRKVAKTLIDSNYISNFNCDWGTWNDAQVKNTFSIYGDTALDTLLIKVQPVMEKVTNLKLIPTYSYARIYKKGDVLERHKDRFSCEISTTLNLGGDKWPIFISENELDGECGKEGYLKSKSKGVKVDLDPGDMLIYRGNILEHWREDFKGKDCAQVFLHFNNKATKDSEKNKYDGRIHLGLPAGMKGYVQ